MSANNDTITEQLYAWLEEAVALRFGPDPQGEKLRVPDYTEGPSAFVQQLLSARQRSDRIDELLSKAKRVRWRLSALKRDAADVAQDKLDEALVQGQGTALEYSTGVERKASANLSSFAEKRAERQAQRRLDVADEVVEAINDTHWGLNGWRSDMRDVVRSFQLESNLER
jgi:hypothetical protein